MVYELKTVRKYLLEEILRHVLTENTQQGTRTSKGLLDAFYYSPGYDSDLKIIFTPFTES
jgi:hypothetical protein